ncbi:MAG: nucleoside triphosphate pyrophosphohydrolase [Xanthomonadales bacterium]|nr:nucleoside triphosphate pyrophosphohydrolase [Xanthomonadales bacterium]
MNNSKIEDLLEIMSRLRDPDSGCPWDVEQDFSTIAPYTIEEAYEVADAIDHGDFLALKDELGDLLFQVVFHARMAEEAGQFDFSDVVSAVCDKMIRRHPHVFGDAEVADARAQTLAWEEHKARERGEDEDPSALAGVSTGLPEWMRAQKLQKRAARVGFDWPDAGPVLEKIEEEIAELRRAVELVDAEQVESEFGDLLFAAVNLSRHLRSDTSRALRAANRKFEARFRAMETLAKSRGQSLADLTLEQMDELWDEVKGREAGTDD